MICYCFNVKKIRDVEVREMMRKILLKMDMAEVTFGHSSCQQSRGVSNYMDLDLHPIWA